MINLKVLSTAAIMALVLPLVAPTASFAQGHGMRAGGGGGGGFKGGGGAAFAGRGGPGGGAAFAGRGGPAMGAAPMQRFSSGAQVQRFNGAGPGVNFNSGVQSQRYAGWNGGYRRHYGGGGFFPGAVAGAVIGSAFASSYGYYDNPGYYAPGYYDNGYDNGYYDYGGAVAVAPGGDDVGYCSQRYRSYDPASGTYLGYDGQRHPCP